MATVFVSPGVYTQEQNFSIFAASLGTTFLGLVGLTQKGPAFTPTQVTNTSNYNLIFGGTDPTLPLSYVATFYLGQSNQLTITRVLGNEGFTNSPAWLIVADNTITYNGSINGVTSFSSVSLSFSYQTTPIAYTFVTSAATPSQNIPLNTVSATTVVGNTYNLAYSGSNASTQSWVNALNATSFSGLGITVTGTNSSVYIISGAPQTIVLSASNIDAKGSYSGATLAILRSQRDQITNEFYFENPSDIQIGNIVGGPLGTFILSSATSPLSAVNNGGYTVSLDETSQHYIVNTLTENPVVTTGYPLLYVERIYPHFIREATADGNIIRIRPQLVYTEEPAYENFVDGYSNAVTPWVVSRVIGGQVNQLFRFQTIPDGDAANTEIKVSIQNINIFTNTFDVLIRNYNDTDATANATAYEYWANCTLDATQTNFIGTIIGTTDGNYPQKSLFVSVDLAAIIPPNSLPAGFQGYQLRQTGISGTTAPQIYYKTGYLSSDTIFNTYLGLSETAFSSLTPSNVSFGSSVQSLESDMWQFDGGIMSSGTVFNTKGFHLENIAPANLYVSGPKNSLTAYTNPSQTLIDQTQLKFTLVPYGGFDGWDKYEYYATPADQFTDQFPNNIAAFEAGIDTMAQPEKVNINVFATPGIDFENNFTVVNYALNTITSRADSLYLIDAPRLTVGTVKGIPQELVSILQSTPINTNYAATYWPWIQIQDPTTNVYTWQPPTAMVVSSIAYTDTVSQPWFAPAGINRGLANSFVIQPDIKLSKSDRDTLYNGRINPIAYFINNGTVIWGQKTLTTIQSSLNRVNIRRLLLQVERLIAAASLTLVFEQNDQTLIDQFLAKVEPILNQIQNQRGITAFNIIMDGSNNTPATIDQNTLNGTIQIIPTPSAEIINLTFQVFPQGASFAAI